MPDLAQEAPWRWIHGSRVRAFQDASLAISVLSEGKLPIYIAEQKGFPRAAEISINILEFRSGDEVVRTFLGGSADFLHLRR